MKRFFRHHARKLLNILFHDRMLNTFYKLMQDLLFFSLENDVWFEHFRQQLILMRDEYLALSSQCLEGGEAAAIDFILNRHVILKKNNF